MYVNDKFIYKDDEMILVRHLVTTSYDVKYQVPSMKYGRVSMMLRDCFNYGRISPISCVN